MDRRSFMKNAATVTVLTSSFSPLFASSNKQEVKIGYLPITDHLTMIANSTESYENMSLKPIRFSSWPELAEALRAKAIDGAFALTPIGLSLKKKGTPIKAVLAGHRNGSVITVKNSNQITSTKDLIGKNIAIPSRFSTHYLLIHKLLEENGINPNKDVRLIDMAPPEMVNAMATGRIDAFIVAEPFGAQANIQNVGKTLIYTKDVWEDHVCCTLNLREELINNTPEITQELVDKFVNAANFIEKNPKEAAKLSKRYLGQKPEVIERVLTSQQEIVSFNNLLITNSDLNSTQVLMKSAGVAKDIISAQSYLDPRFAMNAYKRS